MATRRFILRYLFLPRPEFSRKHYVPREPSKSTGRYNAVEYLSHPWYVEPTFSRRWGLRACMTRLLGRCLPGDNGNRYAPEGYLFEELGPKAMAGKGKDEMRDTEQVLRNASRGKCPFHISK